MLRQYKTFFFLLLFFFFFFLPNCHMTIKMLAATIVLHCSQKLDLSPFLTLLIISTSPDDIGQGCYISREICLFPGRREILGNTGKYKISNNELLVSPVVGMLTLEVGQIRY